MVSQSLAKQIKKLPDAPGVYFFLGRNRKILYIGKATSLKDRVKSYYSKDLAMTRGQLVVSMLTQIKSIDFRKTDSVLEALILEADLIKKFKPHFNTDEKDDKSFLCVIITDEIYPVVTLARKKDIDFENLLLKPSAYKLKAIYGPYPESTSIKEALKIIRKIFPYRDEKCRILTNNYQLSTNNFLTARRYKPKASPTLNPLSLTLNPKLKPCFNFSIGLCPGCCICAISPKEYSKTIQNIKLFFQGKKKKILNKLNKEMKAAAKNMDFEIAKKLRNQIFALEHIRDISLIKSSSLNPLSLSLTPMLRLEAYDIAHMSGKDMVGVMVVMENKEFKKSDYRKFIIRGYRESNDTGALREIIRRRFNHPEWGVPNIIIVDGGETQLNVAREETLKVPHSQIKCVGVVKDMRHKAKNLIGSQEIIESYKNSIIKLNEEAHRFAITFHKKKRSRSFLPPFKSLA